MKILVINGPNLNMLGIREPELYGNMTYPALCNMIYKKARERNIDINVVQSNHEGGLVDKIQDAYFDKYNAIILNAGAYTHTSIAILDALKAVNIPTVEVHITDLKEREDYRQVSYVRDAAEKTIMGHGLNGYLEAIDYLVDKYNK